MHLYPINGAAGRVKNNATPWCYRDAMWAEVMVGVDPDPANKDRITLGEGVLGRPAPVLGRRRVRKLHDGRGRRSHPSNVREELRAPSKVKSGTTRPTCSG